MYPFVYRLNAAGWAHLLVYGLLLPLMVVRGSRNVVGAPDAPLPNRLRYFQGTTIEPLMLVAGSLAVARAERMQLFPSAFPPWYGIVAGIVAYAIAVIFMRPRWRRAVQRNTRVAHLFMPSNATELGWWLVVSVLAGTGEEITWRAVQTGLLAAATGNYPTAVVLSALSFGAAHAVQGWRSSAVIVGVRARFPDAGLADRLTLRRDGGAHRVRHHGGDFVRAAGASARIRAGGDGRDCLNL
jgi:membrane protease YdiL (CAAX protease family)